MEKSADPAAASGSASAPLLASASSTSNYNGPPPPAYETLHPAEPTKTWREIFTAQEPEGPRRRFGFQLWAMTLTAFLVVDFLDTGGQAAFVEGEAIGAGKFLLLLILAITHFLLLFVSPAFALVSCCGILVMVADSAFVGLIRNNFRYDMKISIGILAPLSVVAFAVRVWALRTGHSPSLNYWAGPKWEDSLTSVPPAARDLARVFWVYIASLVLWVVLEFADADSDYGYVGLKGGCGLSAVFYGEWNAIGVLKILALAAALWSQSVLFVRYRPMAWLHIVWMGAMFVVFNILYEFTSGYYGEDYEAVGVLALIPACMGWLYQVIALNNGSSSFSSSSSDAGPTNSNARWGFTPRRRYQGLTGASSTPPPPVTV